MTSPLSRLTRCWKIARETSGSEQNAGLDRYQKSPFVHFYPSSTELRYFPSLVAGDDGSVWINSHGSPLMRVTDGVTTPIGNHVNSGPLAKRRNGDICFADLTSYELQCYGEEKATHAKMPDELKHAPPLAMVEDEDGSLLFSFQGKLDSGAIATESGTG